MCIRDRPNPHGGRCPLEPGPPSRFFSLPWAAEHGCRAASRPPPLPTTAPGVGCGCFTTTSPRSPRQRARPKQHTSTGDDADCPC
eukprot:313848-Alexandrium_andersonii.AAC.1